MHHLIDVSERPLHIVLQELQGTVAPVTTLQRKLALPVLLSSLTGDVKRTGAARIITPLTVLPLRNVRQVTTPTVVYVESTQEVPALQATITATAGEPV
jgi:hypothetical protein